MVSSVGHLQMSIEILWEIFSVYVRKLQITEVRFDNLYKATAVSKSIL